MSLDISLYAKDLDGNEFEVWETNITHNLTTMANKAGLYQVMWHPHNNGIDVAKDAIPQLKSGINRMYKAREELQKLNPENGWGNYDNLLSCASEFIDACRKYPSARIEIDS